MLGAAGLLVVVAVGVAVLAATRDGGPREWSYRDGVPVASDGHELWGRGRLAVEVPEGWTLRGFDCVDDPPGEVSFGATEPSPDCSELNGNVEAGSLAIVPWESLDPRDLRNRDIHGLEVRASEVTCDTARCEIRYGSPASGVGFEVNVAADQRATLSDIVDSTRTLPDGFVAVPYVAPGTALADATRILESEGFVVEVVGSQGVQPSVGDLTPHPGSIVRAGDTLRVSVSQG